MAEISAFVGHSFEETDKAVVQVFLDHLTTFSKVHPSFHWGNAREPQARDVGDKVLDIFDGKNTLIAICTKKERVTSDENVQPSRFGTSLKIQKEKLLWKTSDWIIQEIGVALGKGFNIIILLEDGVREPGTLQGNIERIYFSREEPSRCFDTLDRMLLSLEPKTAIAMATTTGDAPAKPEEAEDDDGPWLTPQPSWEFHQYEFAAFLAVLRNSNEATIDAIRTALHTSPHNTQENKIAWEAALEAAKIQYAEGGKIEVLKNLAEENPNHVRLLESLAAAHAHYQDYTASASIHEKISEIATENPAKMNSLIQAVVMHRKNKDNIKASRKLEELRSLIASEEDERRFLSGITLIFDDNDLESVCARERMLTLNQADTDTRFTLGLAYQNREPASPQLSLFHYLKIPHNTLSQMAWNNLGVAYDRNDLDGKAVAAYKKAADKGETLAMSNLAYKLLQAGFLEEAREHCDVARGIEGYDSRVDNVYVRLKEVAENEKAKEKELLEKAVPYSRFYAMAGHALAKRPQSILGEWTHEKCIITFTSDGSTISGTGSYQTPRDSSTAGLLGAIFADNKTHDDRTITYKITQNGSFFKGTYENSKDGSSAGRSLLIGDPKSPAIMILSEDATTLEVMVEEYGIPKIHQLRRVIQLPPPTTPS